MSDSISAKALLSILIIFSLFFLIGCASIPIPGKPEEIPPLEERNAKVDESLSSPSFETERKDPAGTRKVYIIAVGTDYKGSGIGELPGALDDAAEFIAAYSSCLDLWDIRHAETALIASWDDERTSDGYPSTFNILDAIDSIPAKSRDMIVFYFSGHSGNDDGRHRFYLGRNASGKADALQYDSLMEMLDSKGCPVTMILETCAPSSLEPYGRFENISIAASSSEGEKSMSMYFPADGRFHGAFTYSLLCALKWEHTQARSMDIVSGDREYKAYGRNTGKTLPNTELSSIILLLASFPGATMEQKPIFIKGQNTLPLVPSDLFSVKEDTPEDIERMAEASRSNREKIEAIRSLWHTPA